ncbi:MAG: prepilin peptidase [Epsilonproteobacteria bacterium]|nr:prepilin peptidase [Campylobacterota bacterium]
MNISFFLAWDVWYVAVLALCWGSFLNVLAYRLAHDKKLITARSYCPSCRKSIAWYDNIPLLSWLVLAGKCRNCKKPISWLYPFVELLTLVLMVGLYSKCFYSFPLAGFEVDVGFVCSLVFNNCFAYFVLLSALIAATRTDLEAMVIPQLFSVWLVPIGLICSFFGLTHITWIESMIATLLGYGVLWVTAKAYQYYAGHEGMGEGDMELLAMIGSFLGVLGVWTSLLVGSVAGVVCGSVYLFAAKKGRKTRIPFGPFLALGAVLFLFFQDLILMMLF